MAVVVLTVPVFGALLPSLRLLRLARLLRLLRLGVILARALRAERSLASASVFRFAALITVLVVIVGGAAQAAFNANEFENVWDAIWWAMQTVTTVGYGDIAVCYKSGSSHAAGLYSKNSSGGRVSWRWKVGTRTTPGRWPITVSCGSVGTLRTSFVVT